MIAVSILAACGNRTDSSGGAGSVTTAGGGDGARPGSAGPLASGSDTADCSFISPAQLSAIEGATYAQPTAFHSICSWVGSDGNPLSITLTRNATAGDWESVLSVIETDQAHADAVPISGLGDKAVGMGLEIAVQHGATIIDIRNGDSPGFGKWPKSTAIAETIISRLR